MIVAGIVIAQTLSIDVPAGCTVPHCRTVLSHVSGDRRTVITIGWIGVILVALTGAVLAVTIVRSRARVRAQDAEEGRRALIRACIDVSDVVSSEALREELVDALAEAGVTPVVVATGEPFDSARHHAVGQLRTDNRTEHSRVARMERTGYVDHGRRLRYPDVVVYNANGGGDS